jgi:thiamine kinase-like enzyme
MRIPKTGNILIPKIGEKIEKKLEDLELKPEISPKEFLRRHRTGKHRYFSACQTKDGKKVGFYSRLHFNLDAKNKFDREINFLLRLKKSKLKIKKVVPQIINYGIEKDFEWFVREFPRGEPLGFSRNLFQKVDLKLVPKIVKIIFEIQKIPPNFLPRIESFKVENYLARNVYSELVKEGILRKDLADSIQNFIKKNSNFLEKENRCFCHGDLNLGNIISNGKKIWLIDWELIHLNNFAYDIGYLWSHLWQAKRSFRQNLIFEFMKKLKREKIEKFKILFPVVTCFLALGGIKFKEKKKSDTKKRKCFYSRVFQNCLKFEKLIKL